MYDTQPSTSAEYDDDDECCLGKSQCCKLCQKSDIQLIPENCQEMNILKKKCLPPDRSFLSNSNVYSLFLFIILSCNILVTNGFTHSFTQPLAKVTVKEYDDRGVGIVRFSPTYNGRSAQLQRMVYDKNTNRLVIGAVNHLYNVPTSLAETYDVVIGPEEHCARHNCDVHVKALIVDTSEHGLIECSSINEGICRRRTLGNISNVIEESERKLVPPSEESIVTSLITNTCGTRECVNPDIKTLILGATPIERTDNVYMVAGYDLSKDSKFSLLATDFESLSIPFNTRRSKYYNKIDYITAFEYKKFVYLVMRQSFDQNNGTSKIARFCKRDSKFHSYSEIPLECTTPEGERLLYVQDAYVSNPRYSLALENKDKSIDTEYFFGIFSTSYKIQDSDYSTSGLCVFKMDDIAKQFSNAQRDCNAGNGTKGFDYHPSATPKSCVQAHVLYDCGNEVNPYVNGHNYPAKSQSLIYNRNEFFTSLFIHGVQDANVAFIGTSKGKIHKAVITNSTDSKIFDTLGLTNSPILQDKVFVSETSNLFVMSEHAIYKIKIDHCDSVDNCNNCLKQENPFCGWCLMTNKCTKLTECHSAIGSTLRNFISYSQHNKCPSITEIVPKQQYIATSTVLNIKSQNIHPDNTLKCIFEIESQIRESDITSSQEGLLNCPTPTFENLQAAGVTNPDDSSVIAKLSIQMNRRTLVTTNITFFDCQQYKTCNQCANTTYPCNWCIIGSKCVADTEDNCRGDQIVVSKTQLARLKGPQSCPHFDTENHNNFYIGYGKSQQIEVKISNLIPNMQVFKCQFSYNGHHIKTIPAHKNGDKIKCNNFIFDDLSKIRRITVYDDKLPIDLSILWASSERPSTTSILHQKFGHYKQLDNPNNIKIIVYQCEKLASNCGKCLTLPQHYECGWCEESKNCTFRAICEGHWTSISQKNPRCKHPQIIDFWPKKGPVNGKTLLNITGINLGISPDDVVVTVGSYKCDIINFKTTESILCNTGSEMKSIDGTIVVLTNNADPSSNYTATTGDFRFADPEIERFEPHKGPVSGGTDIKIRGYNLDSGRDVTVKIGNVNCQVRERTDKYLICRTERASIPEEKGAITINVDGSTFSLRHAIQFEFRENPKIFRVKNPISIADGGIVLDIIGKDFDLLQRPRMLVRYEDEDFYSTDICERRNNTNMLCKTPFIPLKKHTHISNDQPLYLSMGFDLDGEKVMLNDYTASDDNLKLKVYPNPQVSSIGNFQTDQSGSDLVLKGTNLDVAANIRDIHVTVGGAPCIVTALASVTLTCQLKHELEYLFTSSDELDVVVKIGNYLSTVGTVSTNYGSPNYMIPVIIAAGICLLLFIILLILFKRKNNSHNRQLRTLKQQMTSIEMKVAHECKEAFHELQTNLNAIAGSLPEGTSFIPFLNYEDYTARILFPHSFNNHPVLRELEVDQDRAHMVESGLKQLYSLINNRTFLLSFVRTIDENKYLLQKDRVYVGSLLMVILQERMDYCTDILKQLLKDLIKRNLEARFQPKILFRRAESVAERMLSVWFSFLMYRYLNGPAGEQLYQFYWATKQQTEKGPQDAITLEARYSLSEEKLLRSTVQCRELTVFVISENGGIISDTQVIVLDSDSITQIKEKCIDAKYRTLPYSKRPTPSEVDLELILPSGTRKLLLDLDQSSKNENGYWKYNTLAHYGVDNKAMLALPPKKANSSSSYNLSLLSDRSDKSISSFHNSPTLTRPFGTNTSNSKDTMRVFHLVRQQGEQDPQEKMMSEIYLTRLLHMKGILQRFIENLFEVVFSTNNRLVRLPACVKYMFDFLDDQAREHGIIDEDVVHAWKSNALPLRFWVNLIKNPDFIFDIPKPTKIEGSLNVVAQTLMDACSTQELHLTKDSPSSKLLFANDIDKYKKLVHNYYDEVAKLQRIPETDMASFLLQESQTHKKNIAACSSALNELYIYVAQNRDLIFEELSRNEYALHEGLPERFQKMLDTMDIMPDTSLINNGSLDNYNSKSRLMPSANSRFY